MHSCCAPCSSTCLERLTTDYEIYDYFYNPNITNKAEYEYRRDELIRLINEMPHENPIHFIDGGFDDKLFFEAVKGLEDCPERGDRCKVCFRLRLLAAARKCKELSLDGFMTTLTLSPLKDADLLNKIGEEVGNETGVKYIPSNFKKKDGYKRSIELSKKYDLYRQNFCGCVFSRRKEEENEES